MRHDEPSSSKLQRAKQAGRTRSPSEVAFLVESMQSTEDSQGIRLWMAAAAALAQYGMETVSQAAGWLGLDSRAAARAAYAYALGKTRDSSAIPELTLLAEDSNPEVVLWAALALAETGDEAVAVLTEKLRVSPNLALKLLFADALNRIPTRKARTALEDGLDALPPGDGQYIRAAISEIDAARLI